MAAKYIVQYDSGEFWQYQTDEQGDEDCQWLIDTRRLNTLANDFKWSMCVQGTNQRKRHARSIMTITINAMLDYVKAELQADPNAKVYCNTPDVEVCFIC